MIFVCVSPPLMVRFSVSLVVLMPMFQLMSREKVVVPLFPRVMLNVFLYLPLFSI